MRARGYKNPKYNDTHKLLSSLGYRVFLCKDDELMEADQPYKYDGVLMHLALHKEKHVNILDSIKEKYKEIISGNESTS